MTIKPGDIVMLREHPPIEPHETLGIPMGSIRKAIGRSMRVLSISKPENGQIAATLGEPLDNFYVPVAILVPASVAAKLNKYIP